MGQITVLDQNMINMIAAGEVIERPASVVKELMENSIDAGATKITVSIEDGGRKLISVTDDGCGMDGGDLAAAFEPHATSKIKTSEDLQGISTLGFRGEALASIASVAQVKAVSRMKDSPGANCVEVDCGDRTDVSPASADYGTTIQVRDIFYKLPARRKFLRTANTEMEHITEHFIRIALANDGLDMALYHNGKEVYLLSGGQGVRGRIAELFSSYEFGEDLIETESSEKDLHISAWLGKPSISRTNSKFQYVFLNDRFIRDKFISHAIKEAYRGCIEPNRFPIVFLFIQMPYENYDVNVHPTKIEVRFYNANLVHSQVLGALREKLLGTDLQVQARMPSGEGGVSSAGYRSPPGDAFRHGEVAGAMAEFFRKHQTVQTQRQFGPLPKNQFVPLHPAGGQTYSQNIPSQYVGAKGFLQIHDSFIVAESDDGFIIVDQHALHERIMYEDLCRRVRESNLESQKLLIPESFELTDAQANALNANAELLEKLGIEITPFGPKTWAIQAFPSLLAKASPLDFVRDLLDLLTDKGLSLDAEGLLDEVLNMAACKAAIKAGQKLTDSEMEQLLADKERTERVSRCPHGRPTVIKFSMTELEKQFGRK